MKWFNIGGPCNPTDNYMLSAIERLPKVMSLIRKKQYFVVHAPRQCGKTTAFQTFVDEINAKGEMAALYCSVENTQNITEIEFGINSIVGQICIAADAVPEPFGNITYSELADSVASVETTSKVMFLLRNLSERCNGKPLVVFFDEVDCLEEDTLIGFLRQLRNGRITFKREYTFPISIALIGLRNIRDYKMRIRPQGQSTGEASPFNVITEAMTIRLFTEEEMRSLYYQHTQATGQVFEERALKKAWEYSQGQPYLVNALARWCVEKIHNEDFSQPITGEDMDEAKEKLIRERGTHLDSLMEKCYDERIRPLIVQIMIGGNIDRDFYRDDILYALDLGLLIEDKGVLKPANPIYRETIGRYMTRGTQDSILAVIPENPWIKDNQIDMVNLLKAFQQFWRENATPEAYLAQYNEAYPHLVLQAFLQRVINGGGQIIREMALGRERLDLGVKFHNSTYAVEVKTTKFYAKSHEKAYDQICSYMDTLGVSEGWLVVFDPDLTKDWDEKIGNEELVWKDKQIHIVFC